jgi:hypothetical protein
LTTVSLGKARLPFRGACSPPYTFSIFLMIDGAIASLPVRGSPCTTPREWHPNGFLSRDSQMGVPKLPWLGLPQLCGAITSCAYLRSQWGLRQSCNPCQDLSNDVLQATCTQGNRVYYWLSVVGSQTANLTPDLSFGHNLCFRCPNGQCEAILDINDSIAFQWYKEKILEVGSFDPCNCSLKFWESTRTPTLIWGVALGVWGPIPSHFLHSREYAVWLSVSSWPATLQPHFALIVSPKLRLRHMNLVWKGNGSI